MAAEFAGTVFQLFFNSPELFSNSPEMFFNSPELFSNSPELFSNSPELFPTVFLPQPHKATDRLQIQTNDPQVKQQDQGPSGCAGAILA